MAEGVGIRGQKQQDSGTQRNNEKVKVCLILIKF